MVVGDFSIQEFFEPLWPQAEVRSPLRGYIYRGKSGGRGGVLRGCYCEEERGGWERSGEMMMVTRWCGDPGTGEILFDYIY